MDRRTAGAPGAVTGKEDHEDTVGRLQEVHGLAAPSPEHAEDLLFEKATHLLRPD
jgi:hypothetical protein